MSDYYIQTAAVLAVSNTIQQILVPKTREHICEQKLEKELGHELAIGNSFPDGSSNDHVN